MPDPDVSVGIKLERGQFYMPFRFHSISLATMPEVENCPGNITYPAACTFVELRCPLTKVVLVTRTNNSAIDAGAIPVAASGMGHQVVGTAGDAILIEATARKQFASCCPCKSGMAMPPKISYQVIFWFRTEHRGKTLRNTD
jgi:hypothetical protein